MAIDWTPLARIYFRRCARLTDYAGADLRQIQTQQLRELLRRACSTDIGRRYDFAAILQSADPAASFSQAVPDVGYEDIRADVMRMVRGERDVLWPGRCTTFAQSSGTSGGQSKYIPITPFGLKMNHYRGGSDVVANYLRLVPESRLFAGKSFILGGSFSSTLPDVPPGVRVGDLSASLIANINPLANLFRVPSKEVALMVDWQQKLTALTRAARAADITNISGVPSWFLTVLQRIVQEAGASSIFDVWPNLEVFFHGGIAFGPYRTAYEHIAPGGRMRRLETYNASEGFFAVQNDFDDPAMLLLVNAAVYYEFMAPGKAPVPAWEVEPGRTYELLITTANGLWRYHLGDTVTVQSVNPLKITIAGRTKTFINAFGEELMEHNAEAAMAKVCADMGAMVSNYTAAPVYATEGTRGRHEWLIEWLRRPADEALFARRLDDELRKLNSDYDAKRNGGIFLDPLSIVSLPAGAFEAWLGSTGKVGGQRKVPRLQNDRRVADAVLQIAEQLMSQA